MAAVVAVWGLAITAKKNPLSRPARVAATSMQHMAVLQALLGIGTLLMHVPVYMGALHQVALSLLHLKMDGLTDG
jgi:heme A synthase